MAAKRKYRWELWFSQPRTVLVRGVDYECSQVMMWQQIRNAARKYGVRTSVEDRNDSLVIEVSDEISHTNKAAIADKSAHELESNAQNEAETEEGYQTLSYYRA